LLSCPGAEYFDVSEDNGRIVLTPVRLNKADAVRSKLAQLGISEDDIAGALQWSREAG
jgi:3-mercaptopyruvate sulfurtransferase SseA